MTRKTDLNVDQVKEQILENRRITIHEVASLVGISFGPIQSILKDKQNMHHTAAKFALCALRKQQQKEIHVSLCQGLQGKPIIPFKDNR